MTPSPYTGREGGFRGRSLCFKTIGVISGHMTEVGVLNSFRGDGVLKESLYVHINSRIPLTKNLLFSTELYFLRRE